MCQPTIISHQIGRIGRRTYDRRMRLASPTYVERRGNLSRLLRDVDALSNQLHDDFPTITAEDYSVFGSQLKILISTLKALRKESASRSEFSLYNERIRQQIVDLEELDHDIQAFRVNAPKNPNLQRALENVASLDFSHIF